jgi:peptidoglycan endopeptidase LytE
VLATADDHLGSPYVWGGTTPRGFDCSGFVQYVFRRHGVQLPRTSRQQAAVGTQVATTVTALRPGDLMLFAANGSRIDHVAIYAGDNRIIHSSASGGGVGYDELSTQRGQWFLDHHIATRRVLANGRSLVADLDAVARLFAGYDPPDRAPRRR